MPDLPFSFYNEWQEVTRYRCNLPHWRQSGVLYFVTFRLADSIPRQVLLGWREEQRVWLAARGIKTRAGLTKLPSGERYEFAKHFNRQVHLELDRCHGACWLRRPEIASIVTDAFHSADGVRCALGDHVIMPNHVHVLVAPAPDVALDRLLQSWKGSTARAANLRLARSGTFWQGESYDRIVRDEKELSALRRYIAGNPAKAKLRDGEYLLGAGTLFGG